MNPNKLFFAFVINQYGGPEVLEWAECPSPVLDPFDVLVRHEAIGLNFIDIYYREGLYPLTLPTRVGSEGAGVVEAIGEKVSLVQPGDRVAYCKGAQGSYAEAHVLPEDCLIKLPDGVSCELAAGVLLKGLTAAYLIFKTAPHTPGKTVLIQAAAGGVGSILVQWCKSLGCKVIGTVGSEDKAVAARANGCDAVILYRQESTSERVMAITQGNGVDIVFDSVGAATAESSLHSLARRGMFVSFGNASGPVEPIAPLTLSRLGSLFMTRPSLGHYIADREEMLELASLLFDAILSGNIKVEIEQRFPLQDAAKAQFQLAERLTKASTILIP